MSRLERGDSQHPAISELVDRYAQDDPHVKKLLRESTRALRKITDAPEVTEFNKLKRTPIINHPDIITPVEEFNNRTPRKILEFAIEEEKKGEKNLTSFEEVITADETKPTRSELRKAAKANEWTLKRNSKEIPQVIITRETERKWLETIQKTDLCDAIRYLRVDSHLDRPKFSKASGVSQTTLEELENGIKNGHLSTINKIIDASSISPNGHAAQLLRLKSQRMEAMDQTELKFSTTERLMKYIRICEGLNQTQLGEHLDSSPDMVTHWENERKPLPKDIDTRLHNWLHLPPDDPLNAIFDTKLKGNYVLFDTELLNRASKSKYLFAVDQNQEYKYTPSSTEIELYKKIKDLPTNNVLQLLRKKSKISQEKVAQYITDVTLKNYSQGDISRHELGDKLPFDYALTVYLEAYGHDIHSPITQYALKKLDEERKQQYEGRR